MKNMLITADIELVEDEAFASTNLNPTFQWVKMVITDDLPNANKQQVPEDEFENLIKTGIHSPIKMAENKIGGHMEAMGKAIGTIAEITKDGNTVKALGALWKRERESDIALLKDMFNKGLPPQISWELGFTDSSVDDNGVEILRGTILNGVTVVANPAYEGRTPIYSFASKSEEEVAELEEELKNKITELETMLAQKETELTEKEAELVSLREFKSNAEKEREAAQKLLNIKSKFKEAGLVKDEDYFESNKEKFISMEEASIDFMIQELVAFKSTSAANTSKTDVIIPPIIGEKPENLDARKLGDYLRSRLSK